MRKFRIKYIKGSEVKFLSHLDILRTFGRAIRRTNVPVSYSQGFNPHLLMSFALPLSVGLTSEAELVDMEIQGDIGVGDFIEKLNKGLPIGLKIINAEEVDAKSNIMALIKGAKYRVTIFYDNIIDINKCVSDLLSQHEILIEKESKKGIKEVDLKPGIKDIMVVDDNNNSVGLVMELSAGSQSNVNPELIVKALEKYSEIRISDFEVHRLELIY